MKLNIVSAMTVIITLLIIGQSCNKNGNVTNISSYNSSESHNQGKNCMNCHKSGGEGTGWFNVAGTVYDSSYMSRFPNATVRLYTGPNGTGTLKYTIEVDALGNFYTTKSIDFGSGLYPSVEGNSSTHYMGSSISMGQCNSCHGVTTDRIWTK